MFPYNIILVNPTDADFRASYMKLSGQTIPLFISDFKHAAQLFFIGKDHKQEVVENILKQLAEKHVSSTILFLQTVISVENMARPKFVIKEWKNGEITLKEKTKSTKEEEFTFINDLPEEILHAINGEHPNTTHITTEEIQQFFNTQTTPTATNVTPPNPPSPWNLHT